MRVLVNAASVKEGGSKVVLLRLLDAMRRQRPEIEWIVAAPPQLAPELANQPHTRVIEAPLDGGLASFLHWYILCLPRAVRANRADILFSITNNLPLTGVSAPMVLLEQHAGHFSETFARLTEGRAGLVGRLAWRFKTWWVRASVRRASALTVQTEALARDIARATGLVARDIHVIPHGVGAVATLRRDRRAARRGPFRIGYVTKWGVQKDFATLFEAVRRLGETRDVRLVLTLDPDLPEVAETLASAERAGVSHLIDNRGDLPAHAVADLYDELDAFAFPSLCESFGFPMVEAMARGLPIVVAGTPENLEVTAGALSYPPGDAATLAERLAGLIDDPAARAAAARASLARSQAFDWEDSAARTLALLEQTRKAHDGLPDSDITCGGSSGAHGRALRGSPV